MATGGIVMGKLLISLFGLLALTACAQNSTSTWDNFAYVNPGERPNYGNIKSLQSPGIY
jgi:hypothetical protein